MVFANHAHTEYKINSSAKQPIGVFDSGIGGITVLKELMRKLPNENFIYLGDTARLPYGTKSADVVRKYSVQNMDFLITKNVKAVVVACNTASTQIFETTYKNIPVYNVIDPGARKAALTTENLKIAVLATRATIATNSYTEKIKLHNPNAEVLTQACPLFVPLAEEGWHDDPITNLIAFRYLQYLRAAEVDTVVLGCTHYPLLKLAISKVFGPGVTLIDSGEVLAQQISDDINKNDVTHESSKAQPEVFHTGNLHICLTDSGVQFENLCLRLLSEVTNKTPQFETVSVI